VFGISETELVLIVLFGFLLFGPDKLPGMGRTIGRMLKQFREAQEDFTEVVQNEVMDPFHDAVNQGSNEDAQKEAEKRTHALDLDADDDDAAEPAAKRETFAERRARLEKEKREKEEREKREKEAREAEAHKKEAAGAAADGADGSAADSAAADSDKAAGTNAGTDAAADAGTDAATANDAAAARAAQPSAEQNSNAAEHAAAAAPVHEPQPAPTSAQALYQLKPHSTYAESAAAKEEYTPQLETPAAEPAHTHAPKEDSSCQ
jgi:hypothetical protein